MHLSTQRLEGAERGEAQHREEFRLVFSVAPVARPGNKPLSGDSGYLRRGIYLVKTLHGAGGGPLLALQAWMVGTRY